MDIYEMALQRRALAAAASTLEQVNLSARRITPSPRAIGLLGMSAAIDYSSHQFGSFGSLGCRPGCDPLWRPLQMLLVVRGAMVWIRGEAAGGIASDVGRHWAVVVENLDGGGGKPGLDP